jgi:hypothetical protein
MIHFGPNTKIGRAEISGNVGIGYDALVTSDEGLQVGDLSAQGNFIDRSPSERRKGWPKAVGGLAFAVIGGALATGAAHVLGWNG